MNSETTEAGVPSTPADQRHKQAIFEAGIVALRRIKGDSTWNDWMAVGEVVLEISNEALYRAGTNQPQGPRYKKFFSELWEDFERKASSDRPITKQERYALRMCMENRAAIEAWRMELKDQERRRTNYPGAVLTKWKAHVERQRRIEDDTPQKPSPYAQLKAAHIQLEEEHHKLKQRAEDGDLWKPTDTAADIARVITGTFTPGKAKAIAEAVLAQLKKRK